MVNLSFAREEVAVLKDTLIALSSIIEHKANQSGIDLEFADGMSSAEYSLLALNFEFWLAADKLNTSIEQKLNAWQSVEPKVTLTLTDKEALSLAESIVRTEEARKHELWVHTERYREGSPYYSTFYPPEEKNNNPFVKINEYAVLLERKLLAARGIEPAPTQNHKEKMPEEKGKDTMPTNKNGKLYYTDEQYAIARRASALAYANAEGYELIKDGANYHLKEHDSMVFKPDGQWFWNSQGLKGGAIEFITHYEQRSLPEAVTRLAGEGMEAGIAPYRAEVKKAEAKPFELPERSDNFKRLFAYLCGTRYLDTEIVQDLIHERKIYEGVKEYTSKATGEIKHLHNAVFLGLDAEGVPRSGYQRGLSSFAEKPFKRDVAGSDKEVAFCIAGRQESTTVAVFEASIDAISHATLAKMAGRDYREMSRLALGGVGATPLLRYLKEHADVKSIVICLDSDAAGQAAAVRLQDTLIANGYVEENGCSVKVQAPPAGKDWNDYLVQLSQQQREPTQEKATQEEPQTDKGEEPEPTDTLPFEDEEELEP